MNTTLQNVVERIMPFPGGQAHFFSYPDQNQIFRLCGKITRPTLYEGASLFRGQRRHGSALSGPGLRQRWILPGWRNPLVGSGLGDFRAHSPKHVRGTTNAREPSGSFRCAIAEAVQCPEPLCPAVGGTTSLDQFLGRVNTRNAIRGAAVPGYMPPTGRRGSWLALQKSPLLHLCCDVSR